MGERIDRARNYIASNQTQKKITDHIKEHKTAYSFGLGGLVFAGITAVIMKGVASQHIGRGISVTAERGISVLADRSVVTNNVSFISSRRQGAPSWVIRCIETGGIFPSQLNAATELGVPASEVSKHLNGLMENVRGLHLERICLAG